MIERYINQMEQVCRQKGIDKYEIRYVKESNRVLQVYEQKVSEARDNSSESLSLVVLKDGKKGRFETADFDEKKIPLIVEETLANALIIDTEETFFFYDGHGEYKDVKRYCPLPQLASLDKVQYLKDLEKLAYDADKRINKVIKVSYADGQSSLIARNSLGLNLSRNREEAYAYIYLSAKDGEVIKTDSESVYFNRLQDFEPKNMIDVVVSRLVSRLNAVNVATQKSWVLFDREVAGDFLGAIRSIFSSYNLDSGGTKLKGKIGEKVASSLVTIVDDPWLENGLSTASFDGEGVPTRYKELVVDGVLQGFVYGMALADKHGVETTGNGGGGLHPIFFNVYIKNGSTSREDMLKQLGNGVYIDGLNGMSAGLSVTSGDFSFGAEGFLVEDGKFTKALNQFTISGNIYDILKDVEAVGNDLDLMRSSTASPSLLVKNLTVVSS